MHIRSQRIITRFPTWHKAPIYTKTHRWYEALERPEPLLSDRHYERQPGASLGSFPTARKRYGKKQKQAIRELYQNVTDGKK